LGAEKCFWLLPLCVQRLCAFQYFSEVILFDRYVPGMVKPIHLLAQASSTEYSLPMKRKPTCVLCVRLAIWLSKVQSPLGDTLNNW
jgi:hypothetical protein